MITEQPILYKIKGNDEISFDIEHVLVYDINIPILFLCKEHNIKIPIYLQKPPSTFNLYLVLQIDNNNILRKYIAVKIDYSTTFKFKNIELYDLFKNSRYVIDGRVYYLSYYKKNIIKPNEYQEFVLDRIANINEVPDSDISLMIGD